MYVQGIARAAADGAPVVAPDGTPGPARRRRSCPSRAQQTFIADYLGRADVVIEFGLLDPDLADPFIPATHGPFVMPLQVPPQKGQTREAISSHDSRRGGGVFDPYVVRVDLSDPYTFRATAIANVAAILGAIAMLALGLSVLVSAAPDPPLHDPAPPPHRGVARDGRRRPDRCACRARRNAPAPSEMVELAVAFNAMADRVQESVEIIRHDRDRSRDFLADVSHELRTPLAALRTFNELLKERAGSDPEARAEFLESSGQQIERLDWLAQNLLELSKLDSGLVLLDLRPDDLRTSVESAVEQHAAAARKRHITLAAHLPDVARSGSGTTRHASARSSATSSATPSSSRRRAAR